MEALSDIDSLEKLNQLINSCKKCPLYKHRTNPVPGEGPSDARIMLIGEAPGYNEDKQGKPFVGRAGKLLGEMLKIIGLDRSKVFITNVVKCRPPGNRTPTKDEIKACSPFLDRQIDIIKPKVIISLGNVASEYILNKFSQPVKPMKYINGKVFEISNLKMRVKVIPMYHPAAILRNPGMMEMYKETWIKIREVI